MNRKDLLIEVYSQPIIKDLLNKKLLTKEQLVEFVLLEVEPEEPTEEPAEEPEDIFSDGNFIRVLKELKDSAFYKSFLQEMREPKMTQTFQGLVSFKDSLNKFMKIEVLEAFGITDKRPLSPDQGRKINKEIIGELFKKDFVSRNFIDTVNKTLEDLKSDDINATKVNIANFNFIQQQFKQLGWIDLFPQLVDWSLDKKTTYDLRKIKPAIVVAISLAQKMNAIIQKTDATYELKASDPNKRQVPADIPDGDYKEKLQSVVETLDDVQVFLRKYLVFDEKGKVGENPAVENDPLDFYSTVTQEKLEQWFKDNRPSGSKLNKIWSQTIQTGAVPKFPPITVEGFEFNEKSMLDLYNFIDKINPLKGTLIEKIKSISQSPATLDRLSDISDVLPADFDVKKIDDLSFEDFLGD